MGVRWRILRARIADSWEVGILKGEDEADCSKGEGFVKMCWGEGEERRVLAAARGSRGMRERCMLCELW
jgi:hypothetical protein